MFEGSQDALNNEALNERFMDCYVRGIYNNMGRPEDVWEVGGNTTVILMSSYYMP